MTSVIYKTPTGSIEDLYENYSGNVNTDIKWDANEKCQVVKIGVRMPPKGTRRHINQYMILRQLYEETEVAPTAEAVWQLWDSLYDLKALGEDEYCAESFFDEDEDFHIPAEFLKFKVADLYPPKSPPKTVKDYTRTKPKLEVKKQEEPEPEESSKDDSDDEVLVKVDKEEKKGSKAKGGGKKESTPARTRVSLGRQSKKAEDSKQSSSANVATAKKTAEDTKKEKGKTPTGKRSLRSRDESASPTQTPPSAKRPRRI